MFESRFQVRVMFFASLFSNPSLDELKLIVNRCKKSSRAQTLASPTEQARRVGCGFFCDLFAGCHVDFCNFISNMSYKCWFIPLAAMWNRRQEGGICFDQQSIQRQLA